jgi:integrase/recombinase XerD
MPEKWISTDRDLVTHSTPGQLANAALHSVPKLFAPTGRPGAQRFIEFFTARIQNANTRLAYAQAVAQFSRWCDRRQVNLTELSPFVVAAWLEEIGKTKSKPTVKQHLAAVRMLFDYLVTGGVMKLNPAYSVRGPKYVVKVGKTPVLTAEEARRLLDSIEASTIVGLRDRAIIGVMVYSFARVSATVNMNVEDYYRQGTQGRFRLHEKGGILHSVPAHHNADAYVNAYLEAAGHGQEKKAPLFQSVNRLRQLTGRRLHRLEALAMVKRRARKAGLSPAICCHTFRATGITAYLENNGTIEHAQELAAHESPKTTKLYDRTNDQVSLDEIEKIVI